MLRQIYTVRSYQAVTSQAHPEGVRSDYGEPIDYDSRSYNATAENPNGESDTALIVAQADYANRIKTLATANTPSRIMWVVVIERHDGQQIAKKKWGAFPDMTPAPEPEPEPAEPEE